MIASSRQEVLVLGDLGKGKAVRPQVFTKTQSTPAEISIYSRTEAGLSEALNAGWERAGWG